MTRYQKFLVLQRLALCFLFSAAAAGQLGRFGQRPGVLDWALFALFVSLAWIDFNSIGDIMKKADVSAEAEAVAKKVDTLMPGQSLDYKGMRFTRLTALEKEKSK